MSIFKKILASFIFKIVTDELIPPLTLFSLITALILSAHFKTPSHSEDSNRQVLGIQEESNNCQLDKCGFCKKCGNIENLNCGQLSRCIETEKNFTCKFDLNCF